MSPPGEGCRRNQWQAVKPKVCRARVPIRKAETAVPQEGRRSPNCWMTAVLRWSEDVCRAVKQQFAASVKQRLPCGQTTVCRSGQTAFALRSNNGLPQWSDAVESVCPAVKQRFAAVVRRSGQGQGQACSAPPPKGGTT